MISENIPLFHQPKTRSTKADVVEEDALYSSETLYMNFYRMSIAFSVVHGCAVTCLAFASTELGNQMGSVTNGTLYVLYAITTFLMARPLVSSLGPKLSLLLGACGYSIYVGGFLVSLIFVDISYLTTQVAWIVSTITAALGGVSGGLIWTAQGAFFAQNSKLFAHSTGQDIEFVNNQFAGVFAASFLGIEMVTKLFATLIYLIVPGGVAAPVFLFSLYTACSIVSCYVISSLDDLEVKPTWDFSYKTVSKSAGAAAKLVYLEPKLALTVPYQLAFGFASSFVPYYIFGTVITKSKALGPTYVGVLSAVVVFTGASISIPISTIANRFGKRYVMIIGGLCLIAVGVSFFLATDEDLGTWVVMLPLLMVYGIGRGIWESTNKAVIADFFSDSRENTTTAFAATAFFNGYAAALAYFTFLKLPRLGMAGTVVLSSLVGIVMYYAGFIVNDVARAEAKIDKKALLKTQFLKYKREHPHSLYSSSEDVF